MLSPSGARLEAAHPRVGGENKRLNLTHSPPVGSSPRGRGKRPLTTSALQGFRLIPAWAGKTNGPAPSPGRGRAHPRVGGENWSRKFRSIPL